MTPTSPRDAAQQADAAALAHQEASRPTLAPPVALACAIAAGIGTALLAQPVEGWHRTGALVLAAGLLAVAFAVPNLLRRRRGLHGYRGQTARDNWTYLAVGAGLLAVSRDPSPTLAVVFDLLGGVVAITWFAVLRNHRWARR